MSRHRLSFFGVQTNAGMLALAMTHFLFPPHSSPDSPDDRSAGARNDGQSPAVSKSPPRRLSWDEVEPSAKELFNVWVGGGELAWAKAAWAHLAEAGLADTNTCEARTLAWVRLARLAKVYHDFCALAWEEDLDWSNDQYLSCVQSEIELDRTALGTLAWAHSTEDGRASLRGASDEQGGQGLMVCAFGVVFESQRSAIYACLCAAYGDPKHLYESLHRTLPSRQGRDEHDDDEDVLVEIFEVTDRNTRAWAFIENGFER